MKGFVTVNELLKMLKDRGDTRKDTAIYQHIHKTIQEGAFPSAEKIGTGTNPYVIPDQEVEAWLQKS